MFLLRPLRMSLHALRRNLFRSALTTLGIVIGIAAVIAMVQIGQGSSTAVQETITRMGANNLLIMPGTAASGGVTYGGGSSLTLTPEDADALTECDSVVSVAPLIRVRTQIIYGNKNWAPLEMYGTTPNYLEVRDWQDLEAGEPFQAGDVRNVSKVCVLGHTVARELFGDESAINKEVRINNVPFKVIGVLGRKGANMMGQDQDDILLAPWTTLKFRVSGSSMQTVNQSAAVAKDVSQQVNTLNQLYPSTGASSTLYPPPSPTQLADTPQPVRFTNIDRILVRAASTEAIPEATQEIKTVLRERHHIHDGQPEDFMIRDMTEATRALGATAQLMAILLLCVALISLVVGGVGIMNIMMVSVTERTREIGLRMAVGARSRDVLRQFLIEAVLLCMLGGILGIFLGMGVSYLVWWQLGWPVELSMFAVVASVGVSVAVGLIFGSFPAWKASRLDPIVALRYE